ncbi:hypothetical protein QTP86_007643 [Hemibagrus guttatus]|nr:hypothetical protein QTP86_007643 [Hemibagrus guttatus]
MCFVDSEKALDRVPRGILWEVLWEYGVRGPLLRAVRSLYNRSRSLVRIASYDVVLLAPSSLDLQHALGHFAAECEAAGMRVSTSKSEAMVLDRKKVGCTLQVGGEFLQVEEFKYFGVLCTSEGRMDHEIGRRISAAAAIMRSMYRSVVVKKELSQKEPLLLHIERGQLRWLGHLFRMPLERLPGEVFWACPTGKRPRGRPRTRWRDYVSWLTLERLGIPPEELEEVSGEREVFVFGIIFTICQGKLINTFSTLAGNLFLCAFLIIGTIITGFIKSELRRQKANQLTKTSSSSKV